MKVAVFGASGTVGRPLVAELARVTPSFDPSTEADMIRPPPRRAKIDSALTARAPWPGHRAEHLSVSHGFRGERQSPDFGAVRRFPLTAD